VASSSSAKKVAKLASRGKGKKVRFSGGTTFPAVVAAASVLMVALIVYAKLSLPSEAAGPPEAGVQWTMAYEFRVCDTTFTIEGQPDDLQTKEASAGDANDLAAGTASSTGFINYRPIVGGNTGSKARLGVFLSEYGITLNTKKLVIPAGLADADELVYDINDSDIFDGTSCEGEKASIKVREWEDASSGAFQDKITDFANLRFTDNGMAWVIAVVPADNDDFEIPQPATASRLDEFGVLGSGTSTSDTTVPDTVADTTADTVADTTADTTADSVADTTTPGTATATTGG